MGLFNRISKKIISKSMNAQFHMFLDDLEDIMSDEVSNRATRRKSGNGLIKLLGNKDLIEQIKHKTPLSNDNQYRHLLYILVRFYNENSRTINTKLFFEVLLKPFIERSKENNFNTRFTNYFDGTIEPIFDTVLELKSYIDSIAQTYKNVRPDTDCDGFTYSIVSKDLVIKKEGIINAELARESKLKYERSIAKRKEKRSIEIKEKEVEPTTQPVKEAVIEVKEKRLPMTTEEKIIQLYESNKLPQQFEEFGPDMIESVLRSNNISKQERIKVVEEYKKIKRTIRIETVVGQEKLKRILTQIDLNEYENFRSSSYVDSLSDEEIRSAITSMPVVPSDPNKVRKKRH